MTGTSHSHNLLPHGLELTKPEVPNATQKVNPPKQMRCTSLSAFQNDGIISMVGSEER